MPIGDGKYDPPCEVTEDIREYLKPFLKFVVKESGKVIRKMARLFCTFFFNFHCLACK